jgi:hypothetical protein
MWETWFDSVGQEMQRQANVQKAQSDAIKRIENALAANNPFEPGTEIKIASGALVLGEATDPTP